MITLITNLYYTLVVSIFNYNMFMNTLQYRCKDYLVLFNITFIFEIVDTDYSRFTI